MSISFRLPLLHSTSSVLLNSKMFYVPFLICKTPDVIPTPFLPEDIKRPITVNVAPQKLPLDEEDAVQNEETDSEDFEKASSVGSA